MNLYLIPRAKSEDAPANSTRNNRVFLDEQRQRLNDKEQKNIATTTDDDDA